MKTRLLKIMSKSRILNLRLCDDQNQDAKNVEQASWKDFLQQAVVIIGMNLHSMSVGVALAFPTVVLSHVRGTYPAKEMNEEKTQLSTEENEKMIYDDEQASWYGGVSVTSVLLGSLIASAVQPRFGRRTVLVVANIFLVTAWSLCYIAQQPTLILASTVLASLYAGSLVAPLLMYQSETLSPHCLDTPFLLSATHISFLFGFTTEMALGAKLNWHTVAAINTAFPSICLIMLFFSLNNSKNVQEKVNKSAILCWFCRSYKGEQERGSISNSGQPESSTSKKSPRISSIVLLMASMCYYHLCGMTVVQTYSVRLLSILSTKTIPSYINIFPAMLGCIQIAGTALGLWFRGWTGRSCRIPLLLASFTGSIGCSLALGLYSHFFVQKFSFYDPDVSISSAIPDWLPTVLLSIFAFCSCMSIPLVPYTFAGEFFPSFAVGLPSRLALFLSCTVCFLCNKFFFYTINIIGLRGLFWTYSITGSMCSMIICTLIPKNLGRNNNQSPWHEMDENLVETWLQNLSAANTSERTKSLSESLQDTGESYNESNDKETSMKSKDSRIVLRNTDRKPPDWLGDISWAGHQGGWLIEETKHGGWRVIERGHARKGEGRSMDVERGTWIGHMLQVVTIAATLEESKDFTKWKLANRGKKRWMIIMGPRNQWQICSAPWDSDTSEESDVEDSESDTESSYSAEENSISVISDDNQSTENNDGEKSYMKNTDENENIDSEKHYYALNSSLDDNFKNNLEDHFKSYKRSHSLGS